MEEAISKLELVYPFGPEEWDRLCQRDACVPLYPSPPLRQVLEVNMKAHEEVNKRSRAFGQILRSEIL